MFVFIGDRARGGGSFVPLREVPRYSVGPCIVPKNLIVN